MKLRLGVLDVPYADRGSTTTGQVAEILEGKYGVMGAFAEAHGDQIAEAVANSFEGELESIVMGKEPDPGSMFASGEARVEELFRDFLDSGEIERMGVEGVPTEAAIKRRSLRFKRKKAPRPRPSFIDTGLYEANMKAKVTSE